MKDIICGMEVQNERFVFELESKKFFFCSQGCLEIFKKSLDEAGGAKFVYDLVIIGMGPEGLDAAIQASELKIDTLLITKSIGSEGVDKGYGQKFEQFLHEHFLSHKVDEVTKIARLGHIFEVITESSGQITAFTLIIAAAPHNEYLGNLLNLNVAGGITINPDCSTSVEGMFVCAPGEGSKAALVAKDYLMEIRIR